MLNPSYALKHYQKNRDKVLQYKKEFYLSKTKYITQFRKIRFIGHSKSSTNHLIKKALDKSNESDKILIVIDNNEPISYTDFYEKYSIKTFSDITVDWKYTFICDDGQRGYSQDIIQNENGSHTLLLVIPNYFLDLK